MQIIAISALSCVETWLNNRSLLDAPIPFTPTSFLYQALSISSING